MELPESHSPYIIWSNKTRDCRTHQQESYPPSRKGGHCTANLMPLPVSHFHTHLDHPPYPDMHILAGSHYQLKTMIPDPRLQKNTSWYRQTPSWNNHHGNTNPNSITDRQRPTNPNHDSILPVPLTLHKNRGGPQSTKITWPRLVTCSGMGL